LASTAGSDVSATNRPSAAGIPRTPNTNNRESGSGSPSQPPQEPATINKKIAAGLIVARIWHPFTLTRMERVDLI
jgi:hypothetical protein